jgi:gluconate 2-dehydrogenase alpha chain
VGDEGDARLDEEEAIGVAYTDVATGQEYEQPAAIVALCAYAINNVHLMLLSGIGAPYDATTQKGLVGRTTAISRVAAA